LEQSIGEAIGTIGEGFSFQAIRKDFEFESVPNALFSYQRVWSLEAYFGNPNVPVNLRQTCRVSGVIDLALVISAALPSALMPFHLPVP